MREEGNPARKRESRALVTSELVERKGREDPKGGRSHAHAAHAAHAPRPAAPETLHVLFRGVGCPLQEGEGVFRSPGLP